MMPSDNLREEVQARLLPLKTLRTMNLTPLFKDRLSNTLCLHEEALKAENIGQHRESVDTSFALLKRHWQLLNSDMMRIASLKILMIGFQLFLIHKLREDYENTSHRFKATIIDSILEATDGREAAHYDQQDDNLTKWPIEELMLDGEHVVQKLKASKARQGNPGCDIQPLIQRQD